jgi:tripartite-type tricarboxylate transporter receptor subunit TctC
VTEAHRAPEPITAVDRAPTLRARCVGTVARAAVLLAICAAFGAASVPAAEPFPSKPVKVVVPYSAGGGTDVLTRTLAQRLSEMTGQPFVVENKPGGDATIGAAQVARAPADGYTIVAVSGVPFLINQSAFKDLPYDTVKDFVPVAAFASLPMVLVSAPGFKVDNAKALVAALKAQPRSVNYAGTDQMTYLGMEMIAKGTGTQMVHVPYKGAGPALNDLLGSHVQVMLSSVSPALPHIREGKLRALAVTGMSRAVALPDVPTVNESILPGYELTAWFGVFAPAGTPPAVVDKLAADIGGAINSPAMKQRLEAMGADPRFMGPTEFKRFIDAENERWTRAFKESGLPSQ